MRTILLRASHRCRFSPGSGRGVKGRRSRSRSGAVRAFDAAFVTGDDWQRGGILRTGGLSSRRRGGALLLRAVRLVRRVGPEAPCPARAGQRAALDGVEKVVTDRSSRSSRYHIAMLVSASTITSRNVFVSKRMLPLSTHQRHRLGVVLAVGSVATSSRAGLGGRL